MCYFSRSTILVTLDINSQSELSFEAGDHIAICAPNRKDIVAQVIQRALINEDVHKVVAVEHKCEKKSVLGKLNCDM